MGRKKSNKEYAIILKTKFGDFYLSHYNHKGFNNIEFVFTQTLSKVSKWKTLDIVEKQILSIKNKLDNVLKETQKKAFDHSHEDRILLSFNNINIDELDNLEKNKIIYKRKNSYYPIFNVVSNAHMKKSKSNIEILDKLITIDAELVFNMIKNKKLNEKDFFESFKKLGNNINLYRKDFSFLQKQNSSNIEGYLDIINASYGFRFLKLKNLDNIETSDSNLVIN